MMRPGYCEHIITELACRDNALPIYVYQLDTQEHRDKLWLLVLAASRTELL